MDVRARVSSKGRVTTPQAVRDAMSISQGDDVLFRLEGQHVRITRVPDLMQLAGSVSVPASKRGTPWDDVLRRARRVRAVASR